MFSRPLILVVPCVIANLAIAATPRTVSKPDAQSAFAEYLHTFQDTPRGIQSLATSLAQGLPATRENLSLLRQSLARKSSLEERVLLVRLLSLMMTVDNRTGMNHLVAADLVQLSRENDKNVAGVATLELSRFGHSTEGESALEFALERKIITADQYYGELAHLFRSAPASTQASYISKFETARNRHGIAVLCGEFTEESQLKFIASQNHIAMLSMLEQNEPSFPSAISQVGRFSDFEYADWLNMLALLKAKTSSRPYLAIIQQQLEHSNVDPRKVIAFFKSPYGQRLASRTELRASFPLAIASAEAFQYSFPTDQNIQDAYANFVRVTGLRPKKED